jgi:hypothetical protein
MGLSGIDLRVAEATGIHDGKVGAQAMADILIGGAQFMLEQLQREQDADGHGTPTTLGCGGEALVKTLLDGAHQRCPGNGIGPLTEGMRFRYKVGDVSSCSGTAQPMLKKANQVHRGLSCAKGGRAPQDMMRRSTSQVPMSDGEKLVTTR